MALNVVVDFFQFFKSNYNWHEQIIHPVKSLRFFTTTVASACNYYDKQRKYILNDFWNKKCRNEQVQLKNWKTRKLEKKFTKVCHEKIVIESYFCQISCSNILFCNLWFGPFDKIDIRVSKNCFRKNLHVIKSLISQKCQWKQWPNISTLILK